MIRAGVFVALICLSVGAQKINLVDRVFEGVSQEKSSVSAKKEIMDQAILKVSEDLIKEIIGESKYSRNKVLIEKKVIKNAARYIPFSKPGDLKVEGTGFKMAVSFRVSLKDLQNILLEQGLFYESDATPAVLPMVKWQDKVRHLNWTWWSDGDDPQKQFLVKENRHLEDALRAAFLKYQFYALKPMGSKLYQPLNIAYRSERWGADDLQNISARLGVQIAIEGETSIQVSNERADVYSLAVRLSAVQILNGRRIAEVSRVMETEKGSIENAVDRKMKDLMEQAGGELASQVFDAWGRGTIGSSLYKLVLKGRLPLLGQEAFKEEIINKVHEIKAIKERVITGNQIAFEMDSLLGPREIAKKLTEFEVANSKIVLETSNDTEVVYKVLSK